MASKLPMGLSFRSSPSFILFVVCTAVFTDTFLYTLIIPIIPSTLTERAGVSPDHVQKWVSILLGSYATASLLASLTIGHLADRAQSRRGPLLLGLCALTASTIMYTFGTTPTILVAARVLQGASGSVVHIVGMALLTDTMGAQHSGESMGWQSVAMLAGIMSGPSVGGLVFSFAGHFAVFGMAFAVLGLDIFLRLIMIEKKAANQSLLSKDSISYGTNSPSTCNVAAAQHDQDHVSSKSDTAVSTQSSNDAPPLNSAVPGPLKLLSNPRILLALWAATICGLLLTALESVLPLYTKSLFGWTPAQSGILFMLLCPSFMIGPFVGRLTDRNGPRTISLPGWLSATIVWLGLSTITKDVWVDQAMLYSLILSFGFSSGLIYTPSLVEISLSVHDMAEKSDGKFQSSDFIARAYSFHSIAYGVGSILGPFWGGMLTEKFGWPVLCISFVGTNVVGACLTYFFSGGAVKRNEAAVDSSI